MRNFISSILSLAALAGCANPIEDAYTKGIHAYTAQNYTEAEKWIRQSAEAGHVDGMAIMGTMYLLGRGVDKNGNQAEYWLRKAANAGKIDAQSMLGIMYASGNGVPKNVQEGLRWLEPAAQAGDMQARQMLTILKTGNAKKIGV